MRTPIHITVSRASTAAIAAIEKAGGTVTTRYYTKFAVQKIMAGQMHPTISLRSHPTTQPYELAFATGAPYPVPDPSLLTNQAGPESKAAALPAGPMNPLWEKMQEVRRQFKYRLPDPIRRKDQEYYRDVAHRGYLQHEVAEGEGPSLFFRPRPEGVPITRAKKEKKVDENRLW